MDRAGQPELARIRQLAGELAATDPGPAGALAAELADAVVRLSERVDALWQLIAAVVDAAGLSAAESPPPEFVQALRSARASGRRGIRLTIDGREWVAALSQQPPAADQAAWTALARLTRDAGDQDEM